MGTLRFFLAVMVVIMHSAPVLGYDANVPGSTAVRTFYIISGYLMTMVYSEKYALSHSSYYYFITNRFYKLFPLYWIVVLLVILFSLFVGTLTGSYNKLQYFFDYYQQGISLYSLLMVMVTNLVLIGQDIISFFTVTPNGFTYNGLQTNLTLQELFFIPIAWTVSVEIIFYLVTPFIATKPLKSIIQLIILVLLFRVLLYFMGVDNGLMIYRFAPTEFLWYLLGVLSYKLYQKKILPSEKWANLLLIISLILLILIPHLGNISDIALYFLTFVGAGALINKFSRNTIDKFLGELSYPIYITHTFVLSIVLSNSFPKNIGVGLAVLVLTLALSIFLNEFFLKRIEIFRKNRIKQ